MSVRGGGGGDGGGRFTFDKELRVEEGLTKGKAWGRQFFYVPGDSEEGKGE